MAEHTSITTAPAPTNRNFIQVYSKSSGTAIGLGFWAAEANSKRAHDIDSAAQFAFTVTTPQSQITDVEFYGATVVMGLTPYNDKRHSLAFLSPAFKSLSEERTTTPIGATGLAGLNQTNGKTDPPTSYVYYKSPSMPGLREYNLENDSAEDLPVTIAPRLTSPLAAYHHLGGGPKPAQPIGAGRYVIYIDDKKKNPVEIVSADKIRADTGLAVVFLTDTKKTYLFFVAGDAKLMRVVKTPNNMAWGVPAPVGKVSPALVKAGAQLSAVLQKDTLHVFWTTGADSRALGHGFERP
ncbi:hypothetical protein QBC39DRAFT_330440 [Podospora conica]|nr:hypothetical protein QBC39DRAFT_330440 [Schizothecium conicum]